MGPDTAYLYQDDEPDAGDYVKLGAIFGGVIALAFLPVIAGGVAGYYIWGGARGAAIGAAAAWGTTMVVSRL